MESDSSSRVDGYWEICGYIAVFSSDGDISLNYIGAYSESPAVDGYYESRLYRHLRIV